jgi:hypothetical protein
MKSKILSIEAVVFLALLTSARAADIFGRWIAQTRVIPESGSDDLWRGLRAIGETVFSFRADGTKLTGTVTDPQGETTISEGKIDGDEVSFVVIRSFGGNEMKVVYEGKVALNEIEFTSKVQGGKGQPQKFIAKREFPRHGDLPIRPREVPVPPPRGR